MSRAAFVKLLVQGLGRQSTALGLMGLQPTLADGASIPTCAWATSTWPSTSESSKAVRAPTLSPTNR